MFSWLLDRHNPNQTLSQSSSSTQSFGNTLKIEKPTFNSVKIEGSKQNITPQKHESQTSALSKDISINLPVSKYTPIEGNPFSIQRNNYVFSNFKTFNETNLFDLGIDISSSDPIFPSLESIISDNPLGENTFYHIPQSYKIIDTKSFQKNENLFLKNASNECLLFIFYSKPRTVSQVKAAEELERRNFVYLSEKQKWKNENNQIFNEEKWTFENT